MMGCDKISFTNSFKNLKCSSPPGRYAFLCTLDMLRISDDMSLLRSDKPSVALIFLMLAGTEFVRFVNKPSSGSTIAVFHFAVLNEFLHQSESVFRLPDMRGNAHHIDILGEIADVFEFER